MPGGKVGDIKFGFYVGIGFLLATFILGFLQVMTLRAVQKGK